MNSNPKHLPFWAILVVGWPVVFLMLQSIPMVVVWRRIARRYPDSGEAWAEECAYQFVAVSASRLRLVRGSPPNRLAWGSRGLRISASLLPQRLCPPILIPWSAVSSLREWRRPLGSDVVKLEVAHISVPLYLGFPCRGGDILALMQKCRELNRAILPGKVIFQSNPA